MLSSRAGAVAVLATLLVSPLPLGLVAPAEALSVTADLAVASLSATPSTPWEGEAVGIVAIVSNVGGQVAGSFDVRLTLDGATLHETRILLLGPGESATVTAPYWTAAPGAHAVSAVVDANGEVAETSDANNARERALAVRALERPDVVVSTLTGSILAPEVGDSVVFSVLATNEGTERAEGTITFLLDGLAVSQAAVSLDPGASSTVESAPWLAVAGQHVVEAVADVGPHESELADESVAIPFTVLAAPTLDLALSQLAVEPASPRASSPVVLRATVVNLGTRAAAGVVVEFLMDGVGICTKTVDLAAGESRDVLSDPWTGTEGRHEASATANSTEGPEGAAADGNSRTLSLDVLPAIPPDLAVVSLAALPAGLAAGDEAAFRALLRNVGDLPSAPVQVALHVDGVAVGELPLRSLAAGEEEALDFAWDAAQGVHQATATADSGGTLAELDESNNVRSESVSVGPRSGPTSPDLLVADVWSVPARPAPGEPAAFFAEVYNRGAALAQTFSVGFRLDGAPLGQGSVLALPAGQSAVVRSPDWLAVDGDHTVAAVADAGSLVAEADESNNARSTMFPVSPPPTALSPDLLVVSAGTAPDLPAQGDVVVLTAVLRNQGASPAAGATIEFTLDGVTVGSTHVDVVAPTIDVVVKGPAWVSVGGFHALRATVIPDDATFDSNPFNDAHEARFFVRQPDLVVESIALDPAIPRGGDDIEVSPVVRNRQYQVKVGGTTTENFETLGGWTAVRTGGASFRAGSEANYTTNVSHSVTRALALGFDGGSSGSDSGRVRMYRYFPAGAVEDVRIWYYVDDYSHNRATGDSMTAWVWVSVYDAEGDQIAIKYYTIAGWSSANDWKAPALDTWHLFQVDPDLDAANAASVRVDLVVDGGNTRTSDKFRVYFDDLSFFAPSKVVDGGAPAPAGSTTVTWDGVALAELDTPALAPGEAAVLPGPVLLDAPPGDHVVAALADAGGAAAEIVETNNALAVPVHVLLPDLVVTDISTSPDPLTQGDAATLSFTVRNDGGRVGPTTLRVRLNTQPFADLAVPGLEPGEAVTVGTPWAAVGGSRIFEAIADGPAVIPEEVETNNHATRLVFVRQPDLRLTGLVAPVADHGQAATFRATVENLDFPVVEGFGLLDTFETPGMWTTVESGGWSFLRDSSGGYSTTRSFSPSTSLQLTLSGGATDGSDYGSVVISRTLAIPRADQVSFRFYIESFGQWCSSFNGMTTGLRIARLGSAGETLGSNEYWIGGWRECEYLPTPQPNAKLLWGYPPRGTWTEVVANPTEDFGIDWTGTASVRYSFFFQAGGTHYDVMRAFFDDFRTLVSEPVPQSGSIPSGPTTATFVLDGATTVGAVEVPSLAPGESTVVETPPWTAVGGNHAVVATADGLAQLPELSEMNNAQTAAFRVGVADLVATTVTTVQSPLYQDEPATIRVDGRNAGDREAPASTVRVTVDGTTHADLALPALPAGATVSVTTPWTPRGGWHALAATFDVAGVVPEESETNNVATASKYARQPDWQVQSFTVAPNDLGDGDAATITLVAESRGDGSTFAPATTVRFAQGSVVLGELSLPRTYWGSSRTLTLPWTAVGGDPSVTATIDPDGTAREKSETNNVGSRLVHVRRPDLTATAVALAPEGAAHGDAATIVATVANLQSEKPFTASRNEAFANYGEWPSYKTGGYGYYSGYSALRRLSTPYAAAVAVSGGAAGTVGELGVRYDLPFERLDRVAGSYSLWCYSHDRAAADRLAAGLRFTPLDAAGAPTGGSYEYWLSAWEGAEDTRAPPANAILLAAKPQLNTWFPFDVHPATDFSIDWTGVKSVRAEIFANGASPAGDCYELYVDDVAFTAAGPVPDGAVARDFVVRFTVDGEPIGDTVVSALPAGASVQVESPVWTALGGDRAISVEVDATGVRAEAVETNNLFAGPVHVRQANLVVDAVATDPPAPSQGDDVALVVTVRNAGDAPAAASIVSFALDGALLGEAAVAALAPGASAQVASGRVSLAGGDHVAAATADAAQAVSESDETDNARETLLRVRQPDLTLAGLGTSPADPQQGDAVSFQAIVRNDGDGPSPATTVAFALDGSAYAEVALGALAPGQTATVSTAAWTATGGMHVASAAVDPAGAILEPDESGNAASSAFRVRQPDLVASGLSTSPASPQQGDSVRFAATVTNAGDGSLAAFKVRFVLDGTTFATVDAGPLAAGASATVTSPAWPAAGGDRLVRVELDPTSAVPESDEANNARELAFRVRQPDLATVAVAASDASVHTGDRITFTATVRNLGDGAAGSFVVRFVLDDGTSLGDRTVSALAPGGTVTVTSDSWRATRGSHTVVATADPLGSVPEISEADNAWRLDFAVQPVPDLLALEAHAGDDSPSAAEATRFRATIRNAGDAGTAPFDVAFLLDGQVFETVRVTGLSPGETVTVETTPWLALPGPHTLRVVLDAGGAVAEGNETNNEVSRSFWVL